MRDIVLKDVDIGTGQGLNLVLEHGESVRFVGDRHSGIEKIPAIVAGRKAPSTGQVLVLEKDVYQMAEPKRSAYRREHIGYVSPDTGFWPRLTVWENVAMPWTIWGLPPAEREKMALKTLEMVGLSYGAYVYPQSLSRGEQRLAALARSVVSRPEIILLNHALEELDPNNTRTFVQALWRCQTVWDFTVLSVSYAVDGMETTKTFYIEQGKIQEERT